MPAVLLTGTWHLSPTLTSCLALTPLRQASTCILTEDSSTPARGLSLPCSSVTLLAGGWQAAASNERAMLLYEDADLHRLHDASHLITSGTLPSWLPAQELPKLLKQIMPACSAAGMAATQHKQLMFLSRKVQENVHVVLCIGSGAGQLQDFYQTFPGELPCWHPTQCTQYGLS